MKKVISRRQSWESASRVSPAGFALNAAHEAAWRQTSDAPPGKQPRERSALLLGEELQRRTCRCETVGAGLYRAKDYKPVVVPNGAALPFKIVDGVKVFHLIAEEVDHDFDPGLRAKCWGFNGRVNSTVIEAVEGERVRIYVTNRLPVATSIHWHGILSAQRHGRRWRPHAALYQSRRNGEVRIHAAPARHADVSLAS